MFKAILIILFFIIIKGSNSFDITEKEFFTHAEEYDYNKDIYLNNNFGYSLDSIKFGNELINIEYNECKDEDDFFTFLIDHYTFVDNKDDNARYIFNLLSSCKKYHDKVHKFTFATPPKYLHCFFSKAKFGFTSLLRYLYGGKCKDKLSCDRQYLLGTIILNLDYEKYRN
ncbi:hypothetical protein BCR32DRAFT_243206 [Anaeromyces robustus]|uniref:Uncharacterized protein n=1 Tax=Anaeromyces robustus TaxID=1754192 RepID=A0A1Y1XE68_9FUNG|nr:hypothetical protein BCR32DRAFT_243206 [Anaeromyces robustus]|eukprot:ORX83674.1 hypothetical protein BCR32DRAFT_243206 [Anaeromyces robustus]